MSQTVPQLILSGFADEAANEKTIDQQFAVFAALGLRYLSIRFIDAGNGIKNIMQLDDSEIELVKTKLNEYGLKISSIGSPIGKVKLLDIDDGTSNTFKPFDKYLEEDVTRACVLANEFACKLIRGFSFYHPKGSSTEEHTPLAVDQLGAIAAKCDQHSLTFGLEVEANLVGQTGQTLAKIYEEVSSPAMVLIFDGANLVTQGFSTAEVFEQYVAMKPGLGWIHIKDFLNPKETGRVDHVDEEKLKHFVPAELGDSGHQKILQDLRDYIPTIEARMKERGVDGVFADMEPHVKGGGQFGGFSGPDGFGVALRSFCSVCETAGIGYKLRDFGDIQSDRGF